VTFRGWPESALDFYDGLEADNSKAYWLDHKDTYERDVKAPMEALLAELAPEYGETKLFRPYRDTRFSRDKSPYKTTIAAMIGDGYVQLSAGGLMAGAGMYHLTPDQLARYRAAVVADGPGRRLQSVVDGLRAASFEVTAMETLKTAPRGFSREHPRVELLRSKGLVALRTWPVASWLGTAGAKKRVVEVFESSAPLLAWLHAHVGPAEDGTDTGPGRTGRARARARA
jgi:uncharacterized protein (TIGR02453 family)